MSTIATTTCPVQPEFLKPSSAAMLLDVSVTTFRAIFPILCARYGLRVVGLAGPKFSRTNLLAVIDSLAERGLDVIVRKAEGVVKIGGDEFPIRSSRSGKSARGRPAKQPEG